MRRQDRAMDEAFALEIIDEAAYGVLALAGEAGPYGLPLSLVRDGRTLYFHTARDGKKLTLIREGDPVWVVFVGRVRVPELYSEAEMDAMMADPAGAGRLIASVFTTEFASAMVRGKIREVMDGAEKERALRLVCRKYTTDKEKYVDTALASGMELTRVFAIDILEVTGKRKKYDTNREEMKFGRME